MKNYTKLKRKLLKNKDIRIEYDKLELEFLQIVEALDAKLRITITL